MAQENKKDTVTSKAERRLNSILVFATTALGGASIPLLSRCASGSCVNCGLCVPVAAVAAVPLLFVSPVRKKIKALVKRPKD